MLPFPKRPAAPNEYDLNTGDYVAYDARHGGHRQPVWGRSTPTPGGNVQVAPHVRADMRMYGSPPPSAPASIAPVAMSAMSQYPGTGSYPAQQTVVVRGRPDVRWGVTLAVAGALLGGVLGITMNNGKHRAAAAAAAEAAPPPVQAVAAPQPVQAPQPIATAVVIPPQPVVAPAPQLPSQAVVIPPTPAPQVAANTGVVSNPFASNPGAQPAVVAGGKPQTPSPAQPQTSTASTGKGPTTTVAQPSHHAAAGGRHTTPQPRHPQVQQPRGMVAAAVPPPGPKGGGNVTDEMKLLREATKESDSSLGGSR